MSAAGTLQPGSAGALTLAGANPLSPAYLAVAFASTPVPFVGGTLVPYPVAAAVPLFTDGAGGIALPWGVWPAGTASGTSIYVQYAIQDPAAVLGWSLSNALQAVTP